MSDSPSLAWYEPPDEPEPPSLADWLKHNNPPKCRDCGGPTHATGEQEGAMARFKCNEPDHCRPTWHSIRPLSQAEREED